MSVFAKVATQSVVVGKCTGTINATETFDASLVELSEGTYPPPHGEAYVMLATQSAPAPDYTTKVLKVSFSKGHPDDNYGLFPDSPVVRVLYVDSSIPTKPVIYEQHQGIARVKYDESTKTFSGEISATLENMDDDTRKTVDVKVDFEAHPHITIRRNPRRPSSRAGHC